eukprot:gene4463-4719_t
MTRPTNANGDADVWIYVDVMFDAWLSYKRRFWIREPCKSLSTQIALPKGLVPLMESFGPPERLLAKKMSCFRSLAKSILYQQLAGSAAAAIYSRFLAACGVPDESTLTPSAVLSVELPSLRACGLSERKASYLHDLAAHFQEGRLSDHLLLADRDLGVRKAAAVAGGEEDEAVAGLPSTRMTRRRLCLAADPDARDSSRQQKEQYLKYRARAVDL